MTRAKLRGRIRGLPFVGRAITTSVRRVRGLTFRGPSPYWEERYRSGGASGPGSIGELARFKARVINNFVREHAIESVVEFGSGDGSQLKLAVYPRYIGLDISPTAVRKCIEIFAEDTSKSFFVYHSDAFADRHGVFTCDLALSLDVVFHLVDDQIYDLYMSHIFAAAQRYVLIYASNFERRSSSPHVRHREFTRWTDQNAREWKLAQVIKNELPYEGDHRTGSWADFYVFEHL